MIRCLQFLRPLAAGVMVLLAASITYGDQEIRQFLSEHCIQCHGQEKQKADRRFDSLGFDLSDETTLGLWQDILDQLNLGEMPPASETQPAPKRLKKVIAAITKKVGDAQNAKRDANNQTVLRRLNRREYLNTIRDLFEFNMSLFDPTVGFPEDGIDHGFDNQGETLVTSSYLLENYFDAAERVIDKAIHFEEQPKLETYTFKPPFDRTTDAHSSWVSQERRKTKEYQSIFQGTKERFGYRPLDDMQQGVPVDGLYRIRIKACGLYRDHVYDDRYVGTDRAEPIRLALVSGSQTRGTLHLRQSNETTMAILDLPDNEPKWVETEIWLDKGFQPRMTYQNGPYFFKTLPHILHKNYPEVFPIKLVYSNWWEVCQAIDTPQIRVHNVEIKGPIVDQWPPRSHQIIFGNAPFSQERIPEILSRFATRAFRRPIEKAELDSLLQLVDTQKSKGNTSLESLKDGLIAVLCSPGFLYLNEKTTSHVSTSDSVNKNQLDDYSIASRLSYFLWSSMPDDELLRLASKNELSNQESILNQAKRMLKDPKAKSFVADFSDGWLHLNKLGQMPPDSNHFRHYYVGELESAMRRETHLFTGHLIDKNLSVEYFLDSDFTFMNRPLAHHYKIDLKKFDQHVDEKSLLTADGFVKVDIADNHRGGLLGQASVLTVTANGIDTSPVIRGVWVLENILGSPPSPPPEGVEPIEPDTRGAVSIRDQLKKHRNVETCAECHQKIDPIGFALENFDAIGGSRKYYDSHQKKRIDTSGRLPARNDAVQEFKDVAGLKGILKSRKREFVRCLADKMLTYACGRRLTIHDRPDLDDIVQQVEDQGSGMQDLILHVVTSQPFLSE